MTKHDDQFENDFDDLEDGFMDDFDEDLDVDLDDDLDIDGPDIDLIEEDEPDPEEDATGEEFFSVNEELEGQTEWDEEVENVSEDENFTDEQESHSDDEEKSSSSALIVAVLMAGILGAGGYYAYTAMSSSAPILSADPAQPQMIVEAPAQPTAPAIIIAEEPVIAEEPDVLTPFPTLPEAQSVEPAEPIVPTQEDVVASVDDMLPQPIPQTQATIPKMNDIMLDTPSVIVTSEAITETTSEPYNIQQDPEYIAAQGEISALKVQLAQQHTKLDTVTAKLEKAVQLEPAPQAVDTTSFENKIRAQEIELHNHNAEIIKLKNKLKNLNTTNNVLSQENTKLQKKLDRTQKTVAPIPVKKNEAKVTVRKPTKQVSTQAVWQLRSARPGTAWLSKKGENEMFRVQVGHEIPGLGQILSIKQTDGRWFVQGSKGNVAQ